ncbi:MAG: glycerophosphodiester phosphodiesterase [Ardenticatenaceae bacterium]|nr:glycerophosphodiester phosphodiesterase [Ardenticatenaceae bacterium]MCB8986742.1 glycerophosphodiester phosphodiesterase [Ardenticatenaceae bacterium]
MTNWHALSSPLVIGHRGASAEAPENTIAAFELALAQGADGVELDVQLAADGALVVIHDARVDRMTSGSGAVADLSLAKLQSLELAEGEQMPTLDEVLEAFGPQLLYNIEVKDFGWRARGTETAVADCIQSHHLEEYVLVSSFNPLALRRLRRCLPPHVPLALIRDKGWLKYGYLLADGEADHPNQALVDAAYMAWAKKRGYQVNVWTVDDPAAARRLAALGVNGLITNKPGLIRESLQNR